MMLSRSVLIFAVFCFTSTAYAAKVKVESKYDLNSTAERFIQALSKAEVPIRAQKKVKKSLPGGFSIEGKEIIFSNPFYGWNLGECHRGLRKDVPMKADIWKDTTGKVWLEIEEPEAKVNAFGVIECGNETDKVKRALDAFVDAAVE